MKFTPYKCPECGGNATSVYERVDAMADLDVGDDGVAEYTGNTEVVWDNQDTVLDEEGGATLMCDKRHQWQAKLEAGETEDAE